MNASESKESKTEEEKMSEIVFDIDTIKNEITKADKDGHVIDLQYRFWQNKYAISPEDKQAMNSLMSISQTRQVHLEWLEFLKKKLEENNN